MWARPIWLIVGLVLMAPAGWYVVRRHRRSLPHIAPAARKALSVCRVAVLLLLVVVLGGPYLRLDERLEQKPIVALLLDVSGSMELPAGPFEQADLGRFGYAAGMTTQLDGKGGLPPLSDVQKAALEAMTRAQLLGQALKRLRPQFDQIEKNYELRTYRVGRRVVRSEPDPAKHEPLPPAETQETALGGALEQAINDAAGRPFAGIVLLTDGRWTLDPAPINVVRRVSGSDRGSSAVPVFSVPVGSSRRWPDVACLDLFAPAEVARDDTVAVIATVGSYGFDGKEVELLLRAGDQTLDKVKLKLDGSRRQQVQLTFTAKQIGPQVLTLGVNPLEGERVRDNNEQSVAVRVDDQKLRVLMIEGIPRWDFRFLDHALRRDKGIEPRFVMESQLVANGVKAQDLPAAAGLPTTAEGFAEYHTVILGDVSPTLLSPSVQEALAQAVEQKGLGLLIQAGTQQMPHAYLNQPLGRLLPAAIAPRSPQRSADEGAPTGGMDAPAFKPFRMHVTPAGSMHPAFALYADATRNRHVWSNMPELYWAAKASAVKPGAMPLAEVETEQGRRPLIVEQFVGRGRVLMLGLDSTFRWRRNVGDQLFYRFWGQAIRHLARKKQRDGTENWIEANPSDVESGAPVAVELYAVNPSGQPLNDPAVSVRVTGGSQEQQVQLELGPEPGHYRGVWTAAASGLYTFGYTGRDGKAVTAATRVGDSGRELRYPTVDRDTLGALADASGGAMLELYELDRLPQLLSGQAASVQRVHEAEVWDNWLVLLLLVCLYCTDVGIRRLMGLT